MDIKGDRLIFQRVGGNGLPMVPYYSKVKIFLFWLITLIICTGISYLIGFILFKSLFFSSGIYQFFKGLPSAAFYCIPGILLAGGISGCIISDSERGRYLGYEGIAYFAAVVHCLIFIFFTAVIIGIFLAVWKYSLVFTGAYH